MRSSSYCAPSLFARRSPSFAVEATSMRWPKMPSAWRTMKSTITNTAVPAGLGRNAADLGFFDERPLCAKSRHSQHGRSRIPICGRCLNPGTLSSPLRGDAFSMTDELGRRCLTAGKDCHHLGVEPVDQPVFVRTPAARNNPRSGAEPPDRHPR